MSRAKLQNKNFNWTPELAYAIGLITTDGSLSKDRRHIDFTSKDKVLIETFKKCLHLNNKICKKVRGTQPKKEYYRIQFGNVIFYRWLIKLGLTPNKSKTISDLKIPDKYFFDFLRGHLDGDGDINTYQDNYHFFKNQNYIYNRIFIRFRSASKNHVEWLREKINKNISLKGHFNKQRQFRSGRVTNIWILKFGKKDSMKLLPLLYHDKKIPCLIRKRKIAELFINKNGAKTF